jgi:hypothetical protein
VLTSGKTVAVEDLQSSQHVFLSSMAAYVGLDPRKDISWLTHPRAEAMQLLAEGKTDAFLGFPQLLVVQPVDSCLPQEDEQAWPTLSVSGHDMSAVFTQQPQQQARFASCLRAMADQPARESLP